MAKGISKVLERKRYALVLKLRSQNETFKTIGQAVAKLMKLDKPMSRQRAHQLWRNARNDGKPVPKGSKMSNRAKTYGRRRAAL